MSALFAKNHHGYCIICGRPKHHISDLRCQECASQQEQSTAPDETIAMSAITYEGKCEYCGGAIYRSGSRSLHSCPIKIVPADIAQDPPPTLRICDQEEITPERAGRIYGEIYRAACLHMDDCAECRRLADIDMSCEDEMRLRVALAFWGKRLPEACYEQD